MTTLTNITPRQAWLALVVVCRAVLRELSGATLLGRRPRAACGWRRWAASIPRPQPRWCWRGKPKPDRCTRRHAQAGITLATAIMYLRILVVVAFFNLALARTLAPPLCGLSFAGLVICALQYRLGGTSAAKRTARSLDAERVAANPLELGPAAIFAVLFVAVSLVSNWAKARVRHLGHLHAGRHCRRHRHRSFRAQSGARRHDGMSQLRAGGRDPDRRLLQQRSQGALCRVFCRRARHRASAIVLVLLAAIGVGFAVFLAGF